MGPFYREVKPKVVKQFIRKYYKWVPVIIWMAVIFMFSNEPAVLSDEKSRFVIYIFKGLGMNLDSALGDLSNHFVRKAGHIIEYFILYLLIINALVEHFDRRRAALTALALMIIYASSDEFHQTFIPGRAGRVSDVFIDSTVPAITSGIIFIRNRSSQYANSKKH